MQIDFLEIIKDSWRFTWKYKVLWFFGFIISFLGLLSNLSDTDSNSLSRASRSQSPSLPPEITETFTNLANNPAFPVIIIGLLTVFVILVVLFWYLGSMSQIALIRAVKFENYGMPERINIKSLWSDAHTRLWALLRMQFVIIFISIALMIVIFIPLMLLTFLLGPLAIFLVCILLLFAIPLAFYLSIYLGTVARLVIYYELGVRESFNEAWYLIKRELIPFSLSGLVVILTVIPYAIIYLIIFFIVLVPLVLGLFALSSILSLPVFIATVIVSVLLALIIISVLIAPFEVYFNVYWTKFVNKFK